VKVAALKHQFVSCSLLVTKCHIPENLNLNIHQFVNNTFNCKFVTNLYYNGVASYV